MRQDRNAECPNADNHTPHPSPMQFGSWADEMSKTHDQIQCEVCDLWAIWVPRADRAEGER